MFQGKGLFSGKWWTGGQGGRHIVTTSTTYSNTHFDHPRSRIAHFLIMFGSLGGIQRLIAENFVFILGSLEGGI